MMYSQDVSKDPESYYSCHCTADSCRERCGHEIVDVLLHEQADRDREIVDALLDLKFAISQRREADQIVELFCDLRRTLEKRHYLAFYRMRRWLENQLEARVSPGRGYAPRTMSIRLEETTLPAVIQSIETRFAVTERYPVQSTPVRVEFAFRAKTPSSQGLLA